MERQGRRQGVPLLSLRSPRWSASSAAAGGAGRIARQHQEGKLAARERIELLLDPGASRSSTNWSPTVRDLAWVRSVPGDGVVTGLAASASLTYDLRAGLHYLRSGSLSETNARRFAK